MLRKLVSVIAILVVLMVALGAAASVPPVAAQTQTTNTNIGYLRIVNALVGIGPVDVFLDNVRVSFALQPKEATPYYFIPSGSHEVTVRSPNGDPLAVPIADSLVDVAPGASLTVIAYEKIFITVAGPGTATVPPSIAQSGAFFVMNDDRSPIALGRSRLAAAHLAVGTPQHLSIGYRSGEALMYQIGLEQPFGTIDIDAGTQTLAVIDADNPQLNLLSNFGDWSFYSNTLYTLIIVPNVTPPVTPDLVGQDSPTPQMFIISAPMEPPSGPALRLRIIHAAHDTAVMDVYIDERLVAQRLSYGRYTEYLSLPNYGHTITLRRFGDPLTAPPLGRAIFTITPENQNQVSWTLLLVNSNGSTALPAAQPGANAPVILNTAGGDVMAAILPDNISVTQRDFSRVRVINAADGVQSVGLYAPSYPAPILPANVIPTSTPVPTLGPAPAPFTLTDPVLFAAEANEREIPAGLYRELNFVPEGGRNNLDQLLNQQLVSGVVYTYVVIGSPTGNPPVQVVALEDYGTGVPLERLYLGTVTGTINVRSAPVSNASSVGKVGRGVAISVLGRDVKNQWVRVRYTDPQTGLRVDGWVASNTGLRITRLGTPVTVPVLPLYNGP